MLATIDITFKLNGVARRVIVSSQMSTLDMLRDHMGLTGTKYACGEGECGACTIVVDGQTLNSCLMFAADCDGREVLTIEGLVASPIGEALRKSFTESGAVQCGFCTPGLMMQASHLLATHPNATRDEIKRGIEGNLCRCTGYNKVVDAIANAKIEDKVDTA